ncbi:diguanylate cyclase (GGDEF)-like protein [Novosphingobium chloroacetimidivorans]|uniref:Diguanylate cyclase (GGDEF)-like protein n=1 Tax=Novosphingobium chloroacetimidivorans TaxID=1428314 RepID=A0A7W7KBX0_9SPHN|nr:GGDEF domain-containing protein [Novosphingobium chloroacetimidivorans]MBB4859946.1 diguanylate cyclase (GGDEF)-like protein [Novosphingobium chloroacetimidivorans]
MIDLQNVILEMIAKGESLSDTAERLCREVERLIPDAICSILTVDAEGRLESLAAPSLPQTYADAIAGIAIGPHVGTCGAAAFHGRDMVSEDIRNDPSWDGYRDLVVPAGFLACWSHPIFDAQDRVIATFAFYYREHRGPSERERAMAEQCARLCTIALDRHRRVLEHHRRATIDDLTGLLNRSAFDAALTRLDCAIPGAWALAVIDLDNLKVVNDTFGHAAGDTLLQHVAARLERAARPESVYRLGGDEFAVILTHESSLHDLDATVTAYLAALSPNADCGGNVIGPRATIGLAVLASGDRTAERVRQNADFALYHAKETGRGGYVRYWPGIGTRMTRRLTAVREVDAALREDRIEAHYQPIIRIETGEIVGLEALCRMRLGQNLVTAAAFHEATTDAQIASALTERMMQLVAADLRSWLNAGIPFQHVSVNVSSADFHGLTILPTVLETFGRENVPLKHVILEVTELVYMADDAGVVQKAVARLRKAGLEVALDDFGTGYASLTHLMTVPVDYIKIDKTFVDRIVDHMPSIAIVEGMIGIAHKLGIRVVAEGVETSEQARQLLALGCTMAQGFFYSPAVSAIEAGAMMLASAEGVAEPLPNAKWRVV